MAYNGLKWEIDLNNKHYSYDFFRVYSENDLPPTYYNKGVWVDNPKFKQYESDIIPIFSFLELERKEYTQAGKINGKSCNFEVRKINNNPDLYALFISQGSNYILQYAAEPITGDWSGSWGQYLGLALGYNFSTKNYVITRGGTYFKHTVNNQSRFGREFGNDFKTNYPIPPKDYDQMVLNSLYQSCYYYSGQGFGVYTDVAVFQADGNINTFMSDTVIPKYPNSDDDPENDDDDPTDPTPSPGDDSSDDIPIPPKPTVDVTGTGFVTLYNPSAIDIRNLAYFMWSGEFLDVIKKMFSAPFDCLIGLKLLYAPLTTGASQTIWLGNVESTVSAPKITDQFTDFDCGSIQLAGYFNSFLDYSPYTKVTIFLPFIGYKELNVDEVMNATLHLTYRVDAYSGACVAFLHVSKNIGNTALNSILYEFDGNAAMDIPFTSGDMTRYVQAILGTAASTAGAVISMGAGAKLSTSSVPQTSTDPWTKNPMEKKTVTGLADLGNGSAELEAGKPHIQRGGSLAGANASMAIKQPYIIIERPMQQMPSDYASFIGIPLNMSKPLSSFSGFTVVSQVFMASSSATDDELNMIDSLLRQGVII